MYRPSRLGMYYAKNFVLPTSPVTVQQINSAGCKKKCGCGGKCKGAKHHHAARSFPPQRKGLGFLGDDGSDSFDAGSLTAFSAPTSFPTSDTDMITESPLTDALYNPASTIYNTPTLVAAPGSGGMVGGSVVPSSSPSWLASLFGAGGTVAAAALAPGAVRPATTASLLSTNAAGQTLIGGIPSSYFLYGGIAILFVSLASGGRRR